MHDYNDIIAAIATPAGTGALAVIRISGLGSIACADRVFRGPTPLVSVPTHTLHYGLLEDANGVVIDEVVASVFHGPRSYTGEDSVELSCHGGPIPTRATLEAVLAAGARHAEPGEFTRRAFLNGRMDLVEAEAVADLIHAQSEEARLSSLLHLQGALSDLVGKLHEKLIYAAGLLELELDFEDQDVEFLDRSSLRNVIDGAGAAMTELLETASTGRRVRDGVRVVICGKPNAGKSSIFNALLRSPRAIVTSMPGTTRDWIEEQAVLNGALLRLIDTAGLRHTDDVVERAGVEMTGERVSDADILCPVIDMQTETDIETHITDALNKLNTANPSAAVIVACNKYDLVDSEPPAKVGGAEIFPVSALTGYGIDRLAASIAGTAGLLTRGPEAGRVLITNARHADCLRRALDFIAKALKALEQGMSNEFIAYEIRGAVDALGEIIGLVSTDDVLNAIFDRFCIGK